MNDALPRVYLSSASLKLLQRTGLVLLFIAAVTFFLSSEPYPVIASDWFAFFAIGAGLVMTLIGSSRAVPKAAARCAEGPEPRFASSSRALPSACVTRALRSRRR